MTMTATRLSWIAVALVLAAAGCEGPASYTPTAATAMPIAAPAQRPSFTVGDEFWFDNGSGAIFVETYTGMEKGLLVFDRGVDQETRLYSPDLALVDVRRPFGADEWFEPDNGALEFPLAPGKKWTRDYRVRWSDELETVHRSRSCTVLDTGWATVPAGTFATYRIACTARELGSADVTHEEVFYAPGVGRIVLRRVLGSGNVLELIEFTRAAPKAQ
jgi:hypothetical protein